MRHRRNDHGARRGVVRGGRLRPARDDRVQHHCHDDEPSGDQQPGLEALVQRDCRSEVAGDALRAAGGRAVSTARPSAPPIC